MLDEVAHRHYPLPTHRELVVIEYPGYREYRLENPRLSARSTRLQQPASSTVTSILLVPLLAVCWQSFPGKYGYPVIAISLALFFRNIVNQLLYESVILIPPHGIQLETHRGIPGMRPLFSSKRFISSTSLQDVVINEGLRGWTVLYYLVAMRHLHNQGSVLEVAYENLLPCHSILLLVLEGIQEIMLYGPARTNVRDANVPN
ncbi:hypothetical protein BDN70DRAFT_873303 [Pholiota conissans]|uniref:Phosphatidylinositol N-acetylglucosaminyltransferase subunit H conserved domain-containing protein n=1 Tax=Pholiota conissans TaxID=109636 RepID=A0A9P5Z9E0_9AGAR|nr:hypothetical protein BDN70DRAFT_873303 [Pholiota conissans]